MQNAGIEQLKLNWRYLAFDVVPEDLRNAISGAKAMKFIGLNLTVPHKLLAVSLVDILDESAATWGAVNTIRFEARVGSEWIPLANLEPDCEGAIRAHGFNTDAAAIIRALREDLGLSLEGACVLVLGAGGAGRVASLKLADSGVRTLWLVNRTQDKSETLAAEIRQRYPNVNVSVGYPSVTVDLILNATSLGLHEQDASPIDEIAYPLARSKCVYDMIYRPAMTPLLKRAHSAGCRTANGMGMLLYQGAKALEIWSGQIAPVAAMKEALRKNLYGA
ncbi:MAG: Shikimate dehydrogenase [Verrucomicrobiales bacterium]|nr:Shikimate dehydrogenase [Verrucomicrobiales bacterium]